MKALQELKRRQKLLDKFQEDSFPPQWKFITSKARLKAALTTRRAGKSMGDALYFLKEGIENPGSSMIYCGLTDASAWRILWKDCLKKLGKEYNINLKGVKSEYTVRLEDFGSVIYFLGVENNEDEMAKALGQKYRLCIVDEAAMFSQDIKSLVYDILFPATSDYEGTVCLTGMPSNNTKSFFYDVTTGAEPGWEIHKWSVLDNPYMAEKMKRQIEFLKKSNPHLENTPTFKQHYLGEWAVENRSRIYNFDKKRDVFDHLMPGREWYYVMGVDLGYDDPTAFCILAYRDYDPNLYVVECYKKTKMTISEVAERIKHYCRYYRLNKIIIDGSAKQAVEELKQRHGLSLTPADKSGKADFIHLCNDDLSHGRVRVKSTGCEALINEWDVLVWDEKALLNKGIYVEPSRAKNHCADAFLYAWRYCYNWVDRGIETKMLSTDDERVEAFWERESQNIKQDIFTEIEKEYGFHF